MHLIYFPKGSPVSDRSQPPTTGGNLVSYTPYWGVYYIQSVYVVSYWGLPSSPVHVRIDPFFSVLPIVDGVLCQFLTLGRRSTGPSGCLGSLALNTCSQQNGISHLGNLLYRPLVGIIYRRWRLDPKEHWMEGGSVSGLNNTLQLCTFFHQGPRHRFCLVGIASRSSQR